MKTQVIQALQEAGVIKGEKGKGKGKVDPAQMANDISQLKKLVVNQHAAMGIPLPYDILDTPATGEEGGEGGGESKSKGSGESKQAVNKGAVQAIQPVQPAYDTPKAASVSDQADALLILMRHA